MDSRLPPDAPDTSSYSTGPGRPAAPSRRGAQVGIFVMVGFGLAFAGLLGVRVKGAMQKRAKVAEERTVAQENQQRKEPVRVVHPEPTKWTPRVDVTGTLRPWRDADVGFETGGRLVRVAVSVGDKVGEGQVLAVLDASRAAAQVGQAESQVRAAEANLALAEDNLRRTEALVATKAVPDAQAEQARQQVALARAQLEGAAASSRLAKTGAGLHSVSAPFAGIVTKAPTGIGSVVNPGVPLIHVEDTSRFRLSVTLGEEDVPLVSPGSRVKIIYRDQQVDGKVIAVVPSLDSSTLRAPVEIEVPNVASGAAIAGATGNSGLLAWSFVRARIEGRGDVSAVRLPATARKPGSQNEVVKIETASGGQGEASRRVARVLKVSFAVADDGSLIVQRGLSPSDEVLAAPGAEMRDGEPVAVGPATVTSGELPAGAGGSK